MTLADTISPEMPFLRRYARALTGTQQSGDAYVVATIEALIADPSGFEASLGPRVALYRAFLKIWASVAVNERVEQADDGPRAVARRTLQSITPRARQALLLTSLEGFSATDAAAALDVDLEQLSALIDRANKEIAEQIRTRVLIIEDEPLIAADLRELVMAAGHEVIAVARTRAQAVSAAKANRPGLVLADIQLADGSSGIDAVNDLQNLFDFPAIFITAFPDRLLTGLRPEPTFLITKPFEDETVKAVMGQALFFNRPTAEQDC